MSAPRRCLGCQALTRNGTRCFSCAKAYERMKNSDVRRAREVVAMASSCWICGGGARVDDPWTADHVVPIKQGGAGGELRPAHRSCNSSRRDRV